MRLPLVILVVLALGLGSVPALAASYTVSVQTSRPSYSGIAQISINGTVSPAPGPNTAVIIVVTNPAGAAVDIEDDPANQTTGGFSQVTVSGPGLFCGGTSCWITGTYVVNATWAGDGASATKFTTFAYQASPPATVSVSCAPSSFAVGLSSRCTASLSGGTGTTTDGELVAFAEAGGAGRVTLPSSPTCALSGNSCSINVTGSGPGQVSVQALYPGDAVNPPSNASSGVTVLAATKTSVTCDPPSFTPGENSTCTARVGGAVGSVAGESIAFSKASSSTGNVTILEPTACTLGVGGSCSITVTGTDGNSTIEAAYPGDSSNAASSGNASVSVLLVQKTTTESTSSSTSPSTVTSTSSPTAESSTTSSSGTRSASGGSDSTLYLAILALVAIIVALGAALWRTAARGKGGAAPAVGNQKAPADFSRHR